MAFLKIGKNTYFLFIDPEGGTDYSLIICLNSFTLNGSTDSTDASSMCGPDQQPGDITSSIDIDAQYVITPDAGQVAASDVFTLWQNSTTVGWKIGKAVPGPGDVTKEGQGFFSAYSETHGDSDVSSFTATIAVQGDIDQDVESV